MNPGSAHGLDRPLYVQYFIRLGNFLTGDLGWSYLNNQAVWDIIHPSNSR
ncbi:MAG: hypothetical protein OXI64_11385 [Defluviicoccus sp.]|nr:hypothetical protein [Defluviicoccus sp.]